MGDDAAKMLRGGDTKEDIRFEDGAREVCGNVDSGWKGEPG
jgi:hypothetical protein